jgi:hypothetical protein
MQILKLCTEADAKNDSSKKYRVAMLHLCGHAGLSPDLICVTVHVAGDVSCFPATSFSTCNKLTNGMFLTETGVPSDTFCPPRS